MSLEAVEKLVKLWRNQAQLGRNKSADMQERMNRGETVTVQAIAGPYVDPRETCADELEAALRAEGQNGVAALEIFPIDWDKFTDVQRELDVKTCQYAEGVIESKLRRAIAAAPSLHKEGAGGAPIARCQQRHQETGQCELRAGHEGSHLAGYIMWASPAGRAPACECGHERKEHAIDLEGRHFCEADLCACGNYKPPAGRAEQEPK